MQSKQGRLRDKSFLSDQSSSTCRGAGVCNLRGTGYLDEDARVTSINSCVRLLVVLLPGKKTVRRVECMVLSPVEKPTQYQQFYIPKLHNMNHGTTSNTCHNPPSCHSRFAVPSSSWCVHRCDCSFDVL